MKLAAIRIDGGTQSRVEINQAAVADYAEALTEGAKLPAVIVFFDGVDHWLADGFHRYHAHRKIDAREIDAEVREGTQRDAVLFSVGANATHGLRRSNADKRKAVETLLADAEWATWTDREIATICGVGRQYVHGLRDASTCRQTTSEPVVRKFVRNGKVHEMNVANIGSGSARAAQPLSADDIALLQSMPRGSTGNPTVYVLGAGGRIKVGYSASPLSRCSELLQHHQDGSVLAAASGSMKQERQVHAALLAERDGGEWFVAVLEDVLDAMRGAGLEPQFPVADPPSEPPAPAPSTPPAPPAVVQAAQAAAAAVEAPAPPAEPEDMDDDGPSMDEIVADLQAENARLSAIVESVKDGDQAAQTVKWAKLAQMAERRRDEALAVANKAQSHGAFLKKQLDRCGRAVDETDPDKIAPKVEALARAAKAAKVVA